VKRFLLIAFCMLTAAVQAQTVPVPATSEPFLVAPQPHALKPFVATYAVYREGKPFGDATMQVVRLDGARWRIDLGIDANRGLLGLAGLNLQQSTLFDVEGGAYRPLSQSTVRQAFFGKRKSTGVYDWRKLQARWQGNVKKTRRGTVPLQSGDMSGLLINLAVLRDARPGASLHYRFVDDGRVRDHQYAVAAEREPQTVDELSYNAMRVNRIHAGSDDETILWVVEGVPTPIRILQREHGHDMTDLRLIEYKGA